MSRSDDAGDWRGEADSLAARLAAADGEAARRSVVDAAFDGDRAVGTVVDAARDDLGAGAKPERVEGEALSRVLSGIEGFDDLPLDRKVTVIDAARREIRDHL